MHFRTLSPLVLLTALGCAGDLEDPGAPLLTERLAPAPATELRPGKHPGELIVDASDGKVALPIPERGLRFDTEQDLYRYLIDELHALPAYDRDGRLVGARGTRIDLGEPYYGDPISKTAVAIDDPLVALIGGPEATVYIAGKPHCLDPAICGDLRYAVTNPDEECDDGFCAEGSSYSTKLWFYVAHGGKTKRTAGGYVTESRFCWKGYIPWVCTRTFGSNELRVAASFEFEYPPATYVSGGPVTGTNVQSVQVALWGIGGSFGSTGGVPGSYCGQFYPNTPPPECLVTDVCSHHRGTGAPGEGTVEFLTDLYSFCEE